MTIMFAGGMTLAVPSFLPMEEILPAAYADQSTTAGMLTVSSTAVQAGQVVKVTINDPSNANPQVPSPGVTADFNSSTLYFVQMIDGSWEAYVADQSAMVDMDSASIDYGTTCTTTHTGAQNSWTNGGNNTWSADSDCTNPGAGAPDTSVNAVAASGAGTPILTATTDVAGPLYNGNVGIDEASWPIITGFEFSDSNIITYGDDSIIVTYGTNNAGNSITGPGDFIVPGQQLQITIDDNGLNYDPNTAETWTFGSVTGTSTTARTTGATTDIRATLGIGGFGTNGVLTLTDSDVAICVAATSGCPSASTYVFVETGTNTGVFEVHDFAGESTVDVKGDADVDDVITFAYGGSSFVSTVATNNASASIDAGANWAPGEAASYTVTDADMNNSHIS
jgi:hypothetical protein